MAQGQFTFAVVGRNEASTLPGVIAQARAAAEDGDQVVFVDSASTDGSAALAESLGTEVWAATEGKGRALAAALGRCKTRYICFVDADLFEWTVNIPATLRARMVRTGAEMVVGTFEDGRRRVTQPSVYWPLVDALFPAWGRQCDPTPLSGQRVIDTMLELGPLPDGYGVETHLNLAVPAQGGRIATTDLGSLRGPSRGYRHSGVVARAVADAILDFALATGRLDHAARSRFENWVAPNIELITARPAPGEDDREFVEHLESLVARPLPAPGAERDGASSRGHGAR